MTDSKIELLQKWVEESNRIAFFGGAGVSTESGIPDYRSVDGLYHQTFKYPPETYLSHSFFVTHTDEFYEFYKAKMINLSAKPNAAHLKLAELEKAGKHVDIITQNIDGLHQAAGSIRVYELHGSVHRNYCLSCRKMYAAEAILNADRTPRCSCGGLIKPDVVLYEEPLDSTVVENATDSIRLSDLLIIGGTSLTVYPAAGLIRYFRGKHLVLINRDPTQADDLADLVIREPIGQVFSQIHI
ncbi:MAG: NAD-dependent protein deacylase [Clostridia bacterium]|nr:NAD-dependent protein deacylase [Clostridia bacterium]